jgi:hypothetical protein
MGRAHGEIRGRCNFTRGVFGQAIQFVSRDDAVVIPQVDQAFAGIHDAITIAFWQKGDDSGHLNDTLLCSNYVWGKSNPALAIHLGCWRDPGQYRWDCGFPWSFENRLAGRHRDKSEWTGRWNHWAFTKDVRTGVDGRPGCMEIYLNGELYDRLAGTDSPIVGVTSLQIGNRLVRPLRRPDRRRADLRLRPLACGDRLRRHRRHRRLSKAGFTCRSERR